ncbi:MAG: YkgJ family cysteine cluster protein [Nitrospinota bacterium]|nr:YkgJ family cysteine cluster protein [Nitrospinota bacterium]
MKKWWEKEPLRFECQPDCFKCCIKPGIVRFDCEDIRKAAAYLDFSIAEFKKTFLIRSDGEWVLEVGENGEPCSFLTDKGCGIHDAKPKQCLSYPFWRENMDSKNMWKLVGGFCPGVDIGPMIKIETIKTLLKKFQH